MSRQISSYKAVGYLVYGFGNHKGGQPWFHECIEVCTSYDEAQSLAAALNDRLKVCDHYFQRPERFRGLGGLVASNYVKIHDISAEHGLDINDCLARALHSLECDLLADR